MDKIKRLTVSPDTAIKTAWRQLNDNGYRILFVVDENQRLLGSVTDGDVRRWILADKALSEPIERAMCVTPVVAAEQEGKEEIRAKLVDNRIDCLPVVTSEGVIVRVVFWDDLFKNGELNPVDQINAPVVIMAGGRGERLDPFTKILPKPLIPIGDKPVIEVIMEKFGRFGMRDFYLSLNYKSNMIRAYFQDLASPFQINYIEEEAPSGTAGSLWRLRGKITSTFFVSNADTIIDTRYDDLKRFHDQNQNKLTLVCSMKHFPIPYGVVKIENGGDLKGISEKPEFDHLVLTGLYVAEPEVLEVVPSKGIFHMTLLIEKLLAEKQKVGVYPIAEKAWMDIGELKEYQQTLIRFQHGKE